MCGVGGIVRPEPSSPVDEQALLRIARAIRHRGPDGFGPLLGLRRRSGLDRVAIIDLPDGWQPFEADREGAALVYNGEVYNFIERGPSSRRWGSRSTPAATPRWSSACSNARASTDPLASTASSRSPGGTPTGAG